jgi:hypothetical protein
LFCQYSKKKIGVFFSKANVVITILQKLAVHSLNQKYRFFAEKIDFSILKIETSVPEAEYVEDFAQWMDWLSFCMTSKKLTRYKIHATSSHKFRCSQNLWISVEHKLSLEIGGA